MSILEIKNIKLEKEGNIILDSINAEIEEGEVTALVGPNGAGKSTLSSVIMGLNGYKNFEGDIIFNGESIKNLPIKDRAKKGITMAWQEPARYEGLTVKQFIDSSSSDGNSAKEVLELMDMDPEEYLTRFMDSGLSGGERKRIELASVIAMDPKLVLLDEPDSGIDISSLDRILEAMKLLKDNGTTVVLITHSSTVLKKAERALLMCQGSIIDSGPSEEIYQYFKNECVPCDHKNKPDEEKL
ncbi:MAG: ATP-binding cassette domain-containing protein [Candidatus Aenigmatarchaeota archaeon]